MYRQGDNALDCSSSPIIPAALSQPPGAIKPRGSALVACTGSAHAPIQFVVAEDST